ncbi:MAG TPA: TSUP family transporter, partial [Chryseosolibacter sp.]|nr:TSUP family transporter [Chryseosolibacter sp.]
DFGSGLQLDIPFMLMFAGFATIGIVVGTVISKHISNEKLKPAFGWFVLVMGIYIISKEVFFTI